MIKYALRCDGAHHWDAWFPSISGYDDQHARGLVDCPFCGSKMVEKAPMAPSIRTSKATGHGQEASPELGPDLGPDLRPAMPNTADVQLPVATQDMGLNIPEPVRAMMAKIKASIEASHDYVGDTFAKEVRAMHEGETEQRPIYGEATPSEVRALIEDDIPVAPLPLLASPKGVKGVH